MITSGLEYTSKLAAVNGFPEEIVLLMPDNEPIYQIDLSKRTIEAPKELSVTTDQEAEIIYFKVDRYFELQDLLQTTCVIIYTNALGESYIYPIPIIDQSTFRKENSLLLPWVIRDNVTVKSGVVKFAFRFYILDQNLNFTYNLNTQASTVRVLPGITPKYVEVKLTQEEFNNNLSKAYYINKNGRYQFAPPAYDANETYLMLADEARLNPGSRLEAIYQQMQEMQRAALKWVEI